MFFRFGKVFFNPPPPDYWLIRTSWGGSLGKKRTARSLQERKKVQEAGDELWLALNRGLHERWPRALSKVEGGNGEDGGNGGLIA